MFCRLCFLHPIVTDQSVLCRTFELRWVNHRATSEIPQFCKPDDFVPHFHRFDTEPIRRLGLSWKKAFKSIKRWRPEVLGLRLRVFFCFTSLICLNLTSLKLLVWSNFVLSSSDFTRYLIVTFDIAPQCLHLKIFPSKNLKRHHFLKDALATSLFTGSKKKANLRKQYLHIKGF